ncbi:hypothetical protein HG536_0F04490 [Torulaspora globosa]|uniref:BolA protein n=1 Tax=Torulaspora globosa TaxID=48254 RepID=A0A7G3ZKT7_9SACH|nr:uncharacterized protein HG536_0F04490 [Torulaspora globosa]QLL34123.1 hypothetical protein HG536_0F04490 [Torulaspora globosa]
MLRRLATRTMSTPPNRSIQGPIAQSITKKIHDNFPDLSHFELFNDSYKHAGHHGIADSANRIESHFRLELASDKFCGMSLPSRHRLVYGVLAGELGADRVHALQLTTRTLDEHKRRLDSST